MAAMECEIIDDLPGMVAGMELDNTGHFVEVFFRLAISSVTPVHSSPWFSRSEYLMLFAILQTKALETFDALEFIFKFVDGFHLAMCMQVLLHSAAKL